MNSHRTYDAVVVGAGFAGLHMLHRLRQLGLKVRVFEAGTGVGGTWYWNRYPGARCDFESIDYSYEFDEGLQQDWEWSERYPAQPEILRYLNHVADRFDLRQDIELETRVEAASYDDAEQVWTVTTDTGVVATARYLFMATGALSLPQMPRFPGLEEFRGEWYHTANWPEEGVDFSGRRVAVIGTGSSGVQVIPKVAEQASHLYVLQRTAGFVVPARNKPIDKELVQRVKSDYRSYRERARTGMLGIYFPCHEKGALDVSEAERRAVYEAGWEAGGAALLNCFPDLLVNAEANETLAEFLREKIREMVHDSHTAEILTPRGFAVGAKRMVNDTNYYQTYNRDNVTLVDVKADPITSITPQGIKTAEGGYEVDAIVFATGFDALTGPLLNIDITGRQGLSLREKWEAGPRTYLGIGVHGFPNMFVIAGPGSPSVMSNVVRSTEHHVEWLTELVRRLEESRPATIEPTLKAEDEWCKHLTELAQGTVFMTADSWYLGANVPGKPRVFMPYVGGVPRYREICEGIADNGYSGFHVAENEVLIARPSS